ncbi:Mu transposase C-terminal domain-containing protein [Anaerophilus nitritogenes]|uniref:Mu transposase C-terminal domain-containing protein n=1 Tax=Anaerophilus nitritogenes TaxID=2498136 RepID=UPI00101B8B89|nr:Mu transposase C-terminal domain-containing protein [Anaerophilus nitritogenes]
MQLTVNMIIKSVFKEVERIERILWIDEKYQIAYVFDIHSNRLPYMKKITDIENMLETGLAEVLKEDPYINNVVEDDMNHTEKEVRDKAWEIISQIALSNNEPNIYIPKFRSKLIKGAVQQFGVSDRTVTKYLKKYWCGGKNINALVPYYSRCGGRGRSKSSSNKKRGRPRKYENDSSGGINIDEAIKRIFKTAVSRYYYSRKNPSITHAYEMMLKDFFYEDFKMKNGVKIPILKADNELPTIGQFKYWFYKERNLKREISARKGKKAYSQENRAITGRATDDALGPGSIFEIDATVCDIYLVSRYNRNWIVGRPILYIIIDKFSRLIAGIHVGFEGPSWTGAMMALANAAMDKVEFCKIYDIRITKEEWPVNYLGESLMADRGELESPKIQELIKNFQIKVMNAPPFQAESKAIVERHFRTIQEKVKRIAPGTVIADFKERGGRDYRLDAKLDIFQFTQIIIKSVLHHNNHKILTNYNRDTLMIEDDLKCIPIELWNWGIKNRAGKLRYVPEELVKLNLMPTDTATITAKGIRFKGIYYGSEIALKENWFETARNFGSWKVDISYDIRNMDYIYMKKDNGRSYEKCFLLSHQSRYENKTLEEIEYLLEKEKLELNKNHQDYMQSNIDLLSEIENIVKKAQEEHKNEVNQKISKTQKIKGINQNRKIEKMINREEEYFELGKREKNEDAEVISINKKEEEDYTLQSDIELLRTKRKERLNGGE